MPQTYKVKKPYGRFPSLRPLLLLRRLLRLLRVRSQPETSERVVSSDSLLQGRSHISIMHNGETYQLRATRLGKLILTK